DRGDGVNQVPDQPEQGAHDGRGTPEPVQPVLVPRRVRHRHLPAPERADPCRQVMYALVGRPVRVDPCSRAAGVAHAGACSATSAATVSTTPGSARSSSGESRSAGSNDAPATLTRNTGGPAPDNAGAGPARGAGRW